MNVIRETLWALRDPKTLSPVSFCISVFFITAAILGYPSVLGYICGTLGVLAMLPAIFADKFARLIGKQLDK